jgi:membrane protein DedA with SNARE-associated domain
LRVSLHLSQANQGKLNIVLVIAVATISAYLGSLPFYLIGKWGKEGITKFLEKYGKYLFITKTDMDKGFDAFDKHGNKIVLLGRVIPIVRTVVSFPAGVGKMNFWVFSAYTLIGTALWSTLLGLSGYYLGSKWEVVSVYVGKYEKVIMGILIVGIILYVARGIINIRKDKKSKD